LTDTFNEYPDAKVRRVIRGMKYSTVKLKKPASQASGWAYSRTEGVGFLCEIPPIEEGSPTTLLKSRELGLLKNIIREIALTDKELG
jgi:hypothetical protein